MKLSKWFCLSPRFGIISHFGFDVIVEIIIFFVCVVLIFSSGTRSILFVCVCVVISVGIEKRWVNNSLKSYCLY